MATGYEDYVTLRITSPPAALSKATLHLQALLTMRSSPRTGADGVSYDPVALDAEIDRTERDITRLSGMVYGIGKPRAVPTRRIDPFQSTRSW